MGVVPSHMVSFCVYWGKDVKRITFTSCLPSQMFVSQNVRLRAKSNLLALLHLAVAHTKIVW